MICRKQLRVTACGWGPRSASGAFSLPELIIALSLLGAATAVMMPLMLSASAHRRAAEQRQFALFQAENLLDQFLAAAGPDTTQAELLRRLTESEADAQTQQSLLPGLERSVTVTERPDDGAKQITVELRWRNKAGHFTTPVRLSGWWFAPEMQP